MEDKEDKIINEYFYQFQNYYISNQEMIKIFNEENKEESKKDWSEKLFHLIDRDWIKKWKSFIGFDNIIMELKNKNKEDILDNDKSWITLLIEKNIKDKPELKKLNNKSIYNIYNSVDTSFVPLDGQNIDEISFQNGSKIILMDNNFDLISEKAWNFFDKEKTEFDGKIQIKIGKKKIIIKFNEERYMIQYPKNNKINDLEKDLIKLKIVLKKGNPNNFINKIINRYPPLNNYNGIDKEYYEKDFDLEISQNEEPFNSGQSSIQKLVNETVNINEIRKDVGILKEMLPENNIDIDNVDYINKIIIKKVRNSSYIIASMYSLSQIKEFVKYFLESDKNNKKNIISSELLKYFKDFLNRLWIKNDQHFNPMKFMTKLNEYNNVIFDFKNEKEPIIYLKEIFNYINEELNNKDEDIKKIIAKSFEEYQNDKNFLSFSKMFQINNNSIVSDIFYGIFLNKYICDSCGEISQNYEKFENIELNYNKFFNYKNKLNNSNNMNSSSISNTLNESMVYFTLDEFIEYYFQQKEEKICRKCIKNKIKNIKTIFKFPKILVININWGHFNIEEGFGQDDNKLEFKEEINLVNYASTRNNENSLLYEFKSVICYPAIDEKNSNKKEFKRFVTISRHIIDNNLYFYQPGGKVEEDIRHFCRRDKIPSVIFFQKK